MICPNCHKTYDDGNVFCVECGVRLVHENLGDNNVTNALQSSAVILIESNLK